MATTSPLFGRRQLATRSSIGPPHSTPSLHLAPSKTPTSPINNASCDPEEAGENRQGDVGQVVDAVEVAAAEGEGEGAQHPEGAFQQADQASEKKEKANVSRRSLRREREMVSERTDHDERA